MSKRRLPLGAHGDDAASPCDALAPMSIAALREAWREVFCRPPPRGLKSDLLRRAVAFEQQASREGGVPTKVLRRLHAVPTTNFTSVRTRTVKPGTRVLRTWQGETHSVLVLTHGVEYRGVRYPSLSAVARLITGTRWSGPRFFGLEMGRDA